MKRLVIIPGILIFLLVLLFSFITNEYDYAEAASPLNPKMFAAEDTLPSAKNNENLPSIITVPSSAGEVSFPHQMHYEDFEVGCKTCHHEINATKLNLPHKEYFKDFWIDCKICHHENKASEVKVEPCSECHHKRPTDIADETLSAKVVIHKNCWQCHEIGAGKEASENCKLCHSGEQNAFKEEIQ